MPSRIARKRRVRRVRRVSKTAGGGHKSTARSLAMIAASEGKRAITTLTNKIWIRQPSTPFQRKHRLTMHYADLFNPGGLNATAATGNQQQFRLNSVFDPDFTGAGHQPRYYDQISPQYSSYRVYRCTFRVVFSTPTTTTCFAIVAIQPTGDTFSCTNTGIANAMEYPSGQVQFIRSDGTETVFEGSVNIWDVDGISFTEWLGMDRYDSLCSTSPTSVPFLSLALGDVNAPVGASSARCTVNIDYEVEFYGAIIPAIS